MFLRRQYRNAIETSLSQAPDHKEYAHIKSAVEADPLVDIEQRYDHDLSATMKAFVDESKHLGLTITIGEKDKRPLDSPTWKWRHGAFRLVDARLMHILPYSLHPGMQVPGSTHLVD